MEFFKSHKVYDFMRVRKYWIFLSIALSALSSSALTSLAKATTSSMPWSCGAMRGWS